MLEIKVNRQFDGKYFSFFQEQDVITIFKFNEIDSDLPIIDLSRVCINLPSIFLHGSVDQENIMVLNSEFRNRNFILFCVVYPKSDFYILIEDEVGEKLQNDQLGQYQK